MKMHQSSNIRPCVWIQLKTERHNQCSFEKDQGYVSFWSWNWYDGFLFYKYYQFQIFTFWKISKRVKHFFVPTFLLYIFLAYPLFLTFCTFYPLFFSRFCPPSPRHTMMEWQIAKQRQRIIKQGKKT